MTAHCKPNNCIMKGEQLADRGGQTLNSGAAQCHWATALKIASESNQHLWAQVSAENTGTSWKTWSTAVLKKPQGQGTKTEPGVGSSKQERNESWRMSHDSSSFLLLIWFTITFGREAAGRVQPTISVASLCSWLVGVVRSNGVKKTSLHNVSTLLQMMP